jgi:hypothetical protein
MGGVTGRRWDGRRLNGHRAYGLYGAICNRVEAAIVDDSDRHSRLHAARHDEREENTSEAYAAAQHQENPVKY